MKKLNRSKFALNLLCAFLCIITLGGCDEKKIKLSDLSWLEGTWVSYSGLDTTVEKWATVTPTLMQGFSLTIKNGDTIMTESIKLIEQGDSIIYEPTVFDQNLGEAIVFPLERSDKISFHFSNPDHDFPQTIRYTKCPDNRFVAEVSAIKNGKKEGFLILFKRVN